MSLNLDIIHPGIEKYLDDLLPERDPLLLELEALAKAKGFPAVGPQVGLLLEILARSLKAKRIMELGSGFGYSGLWFAKALPVDGYLLLTDFREKNRQLAEEHFKRAGKSHMMEFRVGDALALLKEEKEPYDIIFNDIDKELYPQVIEPAYRLLRPGGCFITDNTLWYGRVIRQEPDNVTQRIREFNTRLKTHRGFLTLQLPLRDGVSVSIKVVE
jgi:caffeoyl-CoA O-methyltransferase